MGLRFAPRDALLVPFSGAWLAFAVFWEWSVLQQHGAPGFFVLWGAMFVAIGVSMAVGRFFVDAWVRGRTLYAITDQRALLLRRVNSEKLITATFAACVVERRADGSGNLRFGGRADNFSFFASAAQRGDFSMWVPALSTQVEFVGVPDILAVYRLVNPSPPET
jgi:hypothetical protein